MKKAVLKGLDFMGNPIQSNDFVIGATAYIGLRDSEGSDLFYFRLITPRRLLTILDEKEILDGRATLIVNEFNQSLVEKEINKILDDCVRSSWNEVAKAINRHLNWEYDNTQYETLDEAMAKLKTDG